MNKNETHDKDWRHICGKTSNSNRKHAALERSDRQETTRWVGGWVFVFFSFVELFVLLCMSVCVWMCVLSFRACQCVLDYSKGLIKQYT